MLPFSPADPFQSEDKAPDFSKTIFEIPFNSFSSQSQGSQLLDFEFPSNFSSDDATTSSRGNVGHQVFEFAGPIALRNRRYPQPSLRGTQSQETLPSQSFARFEIPRAASISGAELLSLEGRMSPQTFPIRSSLTPSPATPAIPPLRRKPRLCHRRQQDTSYLEIIGRDSSKTLRTSHHLPEIVPSQKRTQERFEQNSLQARANGIKLSPPEAVHPLPTPAYSHLEEPWSQHPEFQEQQSREIFDSAPTLSHQSSAWQDASANTGSLDFAMCSSEARSGWPVACSCYSNLQASQSVPALARARTDFAGHGRRIQGHPHDRVITEALPNDNFGIKSEQLQSTGVDLYPSLFSPINRAHAPSPPTPLPCPPVPPIPKASSKRRRSGRRKSSLGTLKSPNQFGFVNFTPGDSQKILAGVAPSGSSKTKARRELEAYEKIKKMSLVAEKVFKEAGGDVEKLRATGLLI